MVPSNRGGPGRPWYQVTGPWVPKVPSNRGGGQGAQPRPRARGPVVVTALIEKNRKKIPEYLIKIFNFDHFLDTEYSIFFITEHLISYCRIS